MLAVHVEANWTTVSQCLTETQGKQNSRAVRASVRSMDLINKVDRGTAS